MIQLVYESGSAREPNRTPDYGYWVDPLIPMLPGVLDSTGHPLIRDAERYVENPYCSRYTVHAPSEIPPNGPWYYPIATRCSNPELFVPPHGMFSGVSDSVRTGLRKRGKILLLSYESVPTDERIYAGLHDSMQQLGLPADRLICSFPNPFLPGKYGQWCRERGIECRIDMRYYPFHQYVTSIRMEEHDCFITPEQFEAATGVREKKYLSFNRKPHAHRVLMLRYLYERDLLQHGYVSFPGEWEPVYEGDWTRFRMVSDLARKHHVAQRNESLPLRHMRFPQELMDMLPLVIDEENIIGTHLNWTFPDWAWLSTYFSIVGESQVHSDHRVFLSEKVYKAMANFHPFVVLGCRHSLRHLRAQGFKTFDIDESYDEIEDVNERMMGALMQAKRLALKSPEELHTWYWSQHEVLLHNHRLLAAKKHEADMFR